MEWQTEKIPIRHSSPTCMKKSKIDFLHENRGFSMRLMRFTLMDTQSYSMFSDAVPDKVIPNQTGKLCTVSLRFGFANAGNLQE